MSEWLAEAQWVHSRTNRRTSAPTVASVCSAPMELLAYAMDNVGKSDQNDQIQLPSRAGLRVLPNLGPDSCRMLTFTAVLKYPNELFEAKCI